MSINLKKSTTFWNANGSENMPHSNVKDLQTLNENLNWYAQQVVNAKRDIEYWDVYRFDGSVDSKEDFDSKYAALPNNHALVINVDIDKYQTGDVVIKDNNGEQILVKSKQNGIFKPDTYDKNKETLTYVYANSVSGDDRSRGIEISAADPASIINVYSVNATPTRASIIANGSVTFAKNGDIKPFIKMFDKNGEEVYACIDLTVSSNNYIISNIPPIVEKVVVK